jgi:hypothetical protein
MSSETSGRDETIKKVDTDVEKISRTIHHAGCEVDVE